MAAPDNFLVAAREPPAIDYLNATEEQLLERLRACQKSSPHAHDITFMQSVLAIRAARDQRQSNQELVRQTKALVIVTWVLCAVTAVAYLVVPLFRK